VILFLPRDDHCVTGEAADSSDLKESADRYEQRLVTAPMKSDPIRTRFAQTSQTGARRRKAPSLPTWRKL